jgi:adenine deaminase
MTGLHYRRSLLYGPIADIVVLQDPHVLDIRMISVAGIRFQTDQRAKTTAAATTTNTMHNKRPWKNERNVPFD